MTISRMVISNKNEMDYRDRIKIFSQVVPGPILCNTDSKFSSNKFEGRSFRIMIRGGHGGHWLT